MRTIGSFPAPRYGFTLEVKEDESKEDGSIDKYSIHFTSNKEGTRQVFNMSNADRALAWACGYLFGYTDKSDEKDRQFNTSKPEACAVGSSEVENCR